MLSLPPGIQVFMAIEPVDMRKSFDGAWQCLTLNAGNQVRRNGAFADSPDCPPHPV